MIRFLVVMVALFACHVPVLAETFPAPSPDPHASSWGERGDFELHYYGALPDGTACPPSPNELKYGLSGPSGPQYLHGFTLEKDVPDALRAAFEQGTFCRLKFSGEVRILLHHGRQASIRPTAIEPNEKTADKGRYGLITATFQTIVCARIDCPPGNYMINLDGQLHAIAMKVQLEDHSTNPPTIKLFEGSTLPFSEINGWIRKDGPTAVITFGE